MDPHPRRNQRPQQRQRTGETAPVDPPSAATASSPAASSRTGADDPAYHKLYQEALGWGIAPNEIEHFLKRYDIGQARNLLWRHRKDAPGVTPIEAAAD